MTDAFESSTSWRRRGHVGDSGFWGAPSLNRTKTGAIASSQAVILENAMSVFPGDYRVINFVNTALSQPHPKRIP